MSAGAPAAFQGALAHEPQIRRAERVDLIELGGVWIPASLPALYQQRVAEGPDRLTSFRKVSREDGTSAWEGITAARERERVERLAAGLIALGVKPGDRVGLIAGTRWEWPQLDLAILHAGAVTVGIYPTLNTADVSFELEHAGVRVLILDDGAQLARLKGPLQKLSRIERVFTIDPADGCEDLGALEALGAQLPEREAAVRARWERLGPGDLATIVYTSGTTGAPKGAMLSHGNLCYTARAASEALPFRPGDRSLIFLPLAHALQRVASYGALFSRIETYYASGVEQLQRELRAVSPAIQVCVPRILERFHAAILGRVAAAPPARRRVFHWALEVGRRTAEDRRRGRSLSLRDTIAWATAREVVIDPLKRRLFGDSIRLVTSGGAPIDPRLLEFFYALDVLVLEGWGLTETAAPATLNLPDAFSFGTTGRPLQGTEVSLADDGELLVRGPGVFQGYFRDEEATLAAFDDEGFFRTGDLGEIDAEGYVTITDRKKELIVLSTGKKVAPQRIEQQLQSIPLVENALVSGDGKSYLVALLTLDADAALPWAVTRGILPPGAPDAQGEARQGHLEAIVAHPQFALTLDEAIQEKNQLLSHHEQLRRWRVLTTPWSPDTGYLTPTLKVRRRPLEAAHADLLRQLYE